MAVMATQGAALIFETQSLLSVLGAARYLRKVDTIYFSRRVPFSRTVNPWLYKVIKVVIYFLNRKAKIQEIPMEMLVDYLPLNEKAAEYVSGIEDRISETTTYKFMQTLIHDKDLIRYYQAALVCRVPNWGLFRSVVLQLAPLHKSIFVVPAWDTAHYQDDLPDNDSFFQDGKFSEDFVRIGYSIHRLAILMNWVGSIFLLLFLPLVFLLSRLRYGIHFAKKEQYSLAMPVIWGIHEGDNYSYMGKRPHNDSYLYGDLKPGDILHVFGDWAFSKQNQKTYQAIMSRRGFCYFDKKQMGLSWEILKMIFLVQIRTIGFLRCRKYFHVLENLIVKESPKALFYYLAKHTELGNVQYKVELVKNDYNPGHVINTIVCRQYGVCTVGVQHNALPYECPQMAFVLVDRYIVYGDFYVKRFGKFWNHLTLHHAGRESIDWVVSVTRDEKAKTKLRYRWDQDFTERKYRILFLFPSGSDRCLVSQWDRMYEALRKISCTDLNANFILRFRGRESLKIQHLRRFLALPACDKRFVIDCEAFSTYELMAISDLVITYDGSFSVNDALASGLKVFSFEINRAGSLYFRGYGKDFVLNQTAQVVRALEAIDKGYDGFDCQWELLRKDLNYWEDGKNCLRMRQVIQQAMHI